MPTTAPLARPASPTSAAGASPATRQRAIDRELIMGGMIFISLALFVVTGSNALHAALETLAGRAHGIDTRLLATMILNVALILFGWRRYNDLREEVRQRAEAEERARVLADTDPLTGFLNRRSIAANGRALVTQARRRQRSVAALLLDLDHFKNVNDVHGHAAGDVVLTTVAERIRGILPPSALIARLGGDEFVGMVAFEPADPVFVERLAEQLVKAMAEPVVTDQMHVSVCTSIGIARLDDEGCDIDALVRRADIAMYASKARGRNRYSWFNEAMEREVKARSAVESGIRTGLPLGEFVPYFEQQIDLATGRLAGFEMLMRWENPAQGTVSPDVFIPVAEETGLIGELSLAVMRQAMLDAGAWHPGLTLSVNVSPVQLKDPWFAQKLVKLLVETGFPARRLEVEITESSLFDNLPLAQSIIGSLKNQGIKLALDDFGTGYSSLSHLRALPFDRIKIDKSFVSSMTASSDAAAIVGAISSLGRSLGMPVTAEGIEDAEIERELIRIGCAKGQGWHFGRPMPAAKVLDMLAERGLAAKDPLPSAPAAPLVAPLAADPARTAAPVAMGGAVADDWIDEDQLLAPLRRQG